MYDVNPVIVPTDAGLALVESLCTALRTADSLDGKHAMQFGGSFGAIKDALVTSLAVEIAQTQSMYFGNARDIAECIYQSIVECGENVAYCIDLWNTGQICL